MKRLALPLLITFGLLSICMLMAVYPLSVWESGVRGLSIWWEVLFPSLFPFFVISELLLGLGIVHFMGTLLHPFMRPVFRIPGTGGFVAAISYASGYPVGAKLTAKLWEQKQITREEGERLVAFTTTSDPIFLIGAVSVGFFHMPALAGVLAIAHYGSGLIVGLLMRFHGPKDSSELNTEALPEEGNRLKHAFHAMHQARESDGRSLGQLVQQAIRSSLQLMTVVGGLVVFFSVILELFTEAGLMNGMYHWLEQVLLFLGLPPELSQSLVGGLFEVTLGARYAGTLEGVPLIYKAAAAASILSWGGLSVHAQVVSILNSTPLRYLPFMFARAVHAVLAAVIVFLCWNPIMNTVDTLNGAAPSDSSLFTGIHLLPSQLAMTMILIGGLMMITTVYVWIKQLTAKFQD
ncbi:sporulation integral membrane protein YlbJ [Paenibacillus polygoni]|uniref:Sporulation integral membrane protein YlbJ n=1 Tax=Paenibacillus polygoni TaxID=3050112 RepID=A0ABY8X0S7_9BACL|nr:sporulation integral membrane protein YlbJ [Paenibacillus polygoni]WIV18643.1 sporulation integral membrane protein YlbJ [Paenibacillus polygoni]